LNEDVLVALKGAIVTAVVAAAATGSGITAADVDHVELIQNDTVFRHRRAYQDVTAKIIFNADSAVDLDATTLNVNDAIDDGTFVVSVVAGGESITAIVTETAIAGASPATPQSTPVPTPSQSYDQGSKSTSTSSTSEVSVLAGVVAGSFLFVGILAVLVWYVQTNKPRKIEPALSARMSMLPAEYSDDYQDEFPDETFRPAAGGRRPSLRRPSMAPSHASLRRSSMAPSLAAEVQIENSVAQYVGGYIQLVAFATTLHGSVKVTKLLLIAACQTAGFAEAEVADAFDVFMHAESKAQSSFASVANMTNNRPNASNAALSNWKVAKSAVLMDWRGFLSLLCAAKVPRDGVLSFKATCALLTHALAGQVDGQAASADVVAAIEFLGTLDPNISALEMSTLVNNLKAATAADSRDAKESSADRVAPVHILGRCTECSGPLPPYAPVQHDAIASEHNDETTRCSSGTVDDGNTGTIHEPVNWKAFTLPMYDEQWDDVTNGGFVPPQIDVGRSYLKYIKSRTVGVGMFEQDQLEIPIKNRLRIGHCEFCSRRFVRPPKPPSEWADVLPVQRKSLLPGKVGTAHDKIEPTNQRPQLNPDPPHRPSESSDPGQLRSATQSSIIKNTNVVPDARNSALTTSTELKTEPGSDGDGPSLAANLVLPKSEAHKVKAAKAEISTKDLAKPQPVPQPSKVQGKVETSLPGLRSSLPLTSKQSVGSTAVEVGVGVGAINTIPVEPSGKGVVKPKPTPQSSASLPAAPQPLLPAVRRPSLPCVAGRIAPVTVASGAGPAGGPAGGSDEVVVSDPDPFALAPFSELLPSNVSQSNANAHLEPAQGNTEHSVAANANGKNPLSYKKTHPPPNYTRLPSPPERSSPQLPVGTDFEEDEFESDESDNNTSLDEFDSDDDGASSDDADSDGSSGPPPLQRRASNPLTQAAKPHDPKTAGILGQLQSLTRASDAGAGASASGAPASPRTARRQKSASRRQSQLMGPALTKREPSRSAGRKRAHAFADAAGDIETHF
jgi:hypothetical protein